MATVKENQTLIDSRLAAWLPSLEVAQAKTLAGDKRYFQGLKTHSSIPKDAALSKGDNLLVKPADRGETWGDAGLDPRLGCCVAINEYLTPKDGAGYTVDLEADFGGVIYEKCVNVGPEGHRSFDWRKREEV